MQEMKTLATPGHLDGHVNMVEMRDFDIVNRQCLVRVEAHFREGRLKGRFVQCEAAPGHEAKAYQLVVDKCAEELASAAPQV